MRRSAGARTRRRRHRDRSRARSPPSPSPCRPGASARAARASRAFPARASRAASSTSSRIARRSSNLRARRPPARRIFPGTRSSDYAALPRQRGGARRRLRRGQLQHVPGPAGQRLSYKFGSLTHADKAVREPGRRAQSRMHRDRREARLEGADGLDRRRLQLPRPVEPQPRVRLVSGIRRRDLRGLPDGLARVPGAQALRAGVLFDRHLRLGFEPDGGAGAGAEGALPGRSRPSCAERQYRADRRRG